jgi:hypothetical protein
MLKVYAVYVTNFQPSSAGTTLIYFDTILYGTDYDVGTAYASVQSLFNVSHASCAASTPIGCPAFSKLITAFTFVGLPTAAAYYNDQLSASAFVSPSSPTPVVSTAVGTWKFTDGGEVIALDIPFASYATQQQFYRVAFAMALAQTLGVVEDAIYVNDFQRSAAGTTLIYFEVELSASTSSAISQMFRQVVSLFTACKGIGKLPVGCNAGANSTLVVNMQTYGLPVNDVYYNEQLSMI